jgi:hypothetical protein
MYTKGTPKTEERKNTEFKSSIKANKSEEVDTLAACSHAC